MCVNIDEMEERVKSLGIALWFIRKSTHNTLTRIFRHSNFVVLFDVLHILHFSPLISPGVLPFSRYIAMAYDIMLISGTLDNIGICFYIEKMEKAYQKQVSFFLNLLRPNFAE